MKKSIIIIAIIVAVILAAGAGFWKWKSGEKAEIIKQNEARQQAQNQAQNQEQQPQQIPEDQLVWYEIPELDIKFKVTPDTKEDLGYDFKKYSMKISEIETSSSSFYSVSERKNKKCVLSENGFSCGRFDVTSISKDSADLYRKTAEQEWCSGQFEFRYLISNNNYCFYVNSNMLDKVLDNNEYEQMFHANDNSQNKEFGIFLDTVRPVRDEN